MVLVRAQLRAYALLTAVQAAERTLRALGGWSTRLGVGRIVHSGRTRGGWSRLEGVLAAGRLGG